MTKAGVWGHKREDARISVTEIWASFLNLPAETESQKASMQVGEDRITDLAFYLEGRVKISQLFRSDLAQNSSVSCRQKVQGKPC